MNHNKKLPAFTIMEVTIAMLVAGIAIAITFTAYRIVSGSYIVFTKKQERVATLTVLDKLLKQDFYNASGIVRSEDGLIFKINGGIVNYSFTDSCILRNQFALQTDTFKIRVNELGYLFEGNASASADRVDQFSFTTSVEGEQVPLQYQKIYSAYDLFQ